MAPASDIMKKIRVLLVSEYFPPKIMGGGEINLFLLAKTLAEKDVDVYVLTSHHKRLKTYEENEGVNIYRRLKTGSNATGIISNFKRRFIFPNSVVDEIIKIKKEIDIDVIHFIGTSVIAAKKLKDVKKLLFATIESYPTLCPKGDRIYHGAGECKIVCSFTEFLKCQFNSSEIGKMKNRFYLKYNPLFLTYLYRYYKKLNNSLKYCNLIAISNYIKNLLKKHGMESKVVPNVIDVSKFYSKKRKPGKVRIVYLGSLTKYKGAHILLQALKGLNCRCDLYGEGIMKDELNKMILDYDLDVEIHSPVPYEKIPLLYANSDIVVFPSVWPEPFGRIAIEAMAAGKAVIGSDIGGIKETVEKVAGIIIKPGNVDGLRKALKKLIDNPKLRANMGNMGVKAVKKYSKENVIKKIIKEYNSV